MPWLLTLLLAACTVIDSHQPPPPDWPSLRIVEHHVSHQAMREVCTQYAPQGMSPEACAQFYFDKGECHLWFSSDFPPARWMIEHEHLHCRGHDHVGDSTLRHIWESWKHRTSTEEGK